MTGKALSDRYQDVFGALAGAPLEPDRWVTVCDALAALVDARGCGLIPETTAQRSLAMPASSSIEGLKHAYIVDGWYLRDIRATAHTVHVMRRTGFMRDQDVLPYDAIGKNAFYQEFLAREELRWYVCFEFSSGHDEWGASIQAGPEREPFCDDDLAVLDKVRPALNLAARQSALFGHQRVDGLGRVISEAGSGIVALGWAGTPVTLNAAADDFIGRAGLTIKDRLVSPDPEVDGGLAALQAAALAYDPQAPAPLPRPVAIGTPEGSYSIEAIPMPRDFQSIAANVAALVVLRPVPPRLEGIRGLLRQCFDLSPSEIALATALGEGMSLAEAADRQGITVGTARSYLKSIFLKTDTHSQAQLVALIGRLA